MKKLILVPILLLGCLMTGYSHPENAVGGERLAFSSEKQAESILGTEAASLWKKGNEQLLSGKYEEAIGFYTQSIELAPKDANNYLNRGYAYQCQNKRSLAIEDFSKFIELAPNDPIGYYYRGWIKYYQEDYIGAMADFNEQIQLNPNSAIAYYNRGSAKLALTDYYGAVTDYKKAIELNVNFSMAYNNLGWAYCQLKNYTEAEIAVNKAIDLDNKNFLAYDTRAQLEYETNRFDLCLKDCNNALNFNQNLSNSYFIRGQAKLKLGDKNGAHEDLNKAGQLGKTEAFEFLSRL